MGNLTFDEWRRQRPQDFSRACQTLIAANRIEADFVAPMKPASTAPNLWTILISAIVGAFLALLGGEWKSRRDRQMQAAQLLRSAAVTFRREGNAAIKVLSAPMARSDGSAYYAARDELAGRLHESAAVRTSSLSSALLSEIQGAKATSVVEAWPQDATAREARGQEATQWLSAVEEDAMTVAGSVQRLWVWRKQTSMARTKQIGE